MYHSEIIMAIYGQYCLIVIFNFWLQFSCCGYNGPSDWLNTTYMNTSSLIVPQTCHCNNSVPEYTLNCNATLSNYPRLYIWNKVSQ